MFELREAISTTDYSLGITLFKEYASELPISLDFQNFEKEIKSVRGQYSAPSGVLIIAYDSRNYVAGCAAVRMLENEVCELKRMFVKSQIRGFRLGKQLLVKSIDHAKNLGYKKMRLDTLPDMKVAINLYKSLGFYEIKPYRFNPIKGAKYLEIEL